MKIKINHSKGTYPVSISFGKLRNQLSTEKSLIGRDSLIVIDSKVKRLHWSYISKSLGKHFNILGIYKLHAHEKNKSLSEVNKILSFLFTSKCDRQTLLISIGGGITGDIASFAANIFMRGIEYINIPTTLLAMVDSSIGGKTGVNYNSGKNLIGTLYQPRAVFIDASFLLTLPQREIRSGLGEIVKYSFISNNKNRFIFEKKILQVLRNDFSGIEKTIGECIKIKTVVVESDEEEKSGTRKILNLGHTFAHGIESASVSKIKHGEAVLLGIISSLFYSYRSKLISAEFLYKSLLEMKSFSFFLKDHLEHINPEKIYKFMVLDKKKMNSKINLVLIVNRGEIIIDFPGKKNNILNSLGDMMVWLKESFKKETVEK